MDNILLMMITLNSKIISDINKVLFLNALELEKELEITNTYGETLVFNKQGHSASLIDANGKKTSIDISSYGVSLLNEILVFDIPINEQVKKQLEDM